MIERVKGPKWFAEPMNQVIDAVNRTKLVRGDGVIVSENPSGELISVIPRKKSSEASKKPKKFCWEPLNSLVYRFPDGTIDQANTFNGPPYWGLGCTSDNPGAKPGDIVTGEARMSITGEWAVPQNSGISIWVNGQLVPLNGFPVGGQPAGIQIYAPPFLMCEISFDGVSQRAVLGLDSGAVQMIDLQYTTTEMDIVWAAPIRTDDFFFYNTPELLAHPPKLNRGTFTTTGIFQLDKRCIQLGAPGDKIITLPDPNTGQPITYDCVYPFHGAFITSNYDVDYPNGTIPATIKELNLTCAPGHITDFDTTMKTLFPPDSIVWGRNKKSGPWTFWSGGYLPMPVSIIDNGAILSDPLDLPNFVINLYGSGTAQYNFFAGWYPADSMPQAASAAYMKARAEILARSGTYEQWQAQLAAILTDLNTYRVFPATFDKPITVSQQAKLTSPFYLHAVNTAT